MKKYIILIITLVVGLSLGWLFFSGGGSNVKDNQSSESVDYWTCSMHPNVHSKEPGNCPICGMELIPAKSGTSDVDNSAITLNENQIRIANINTMVIGKGIANNNIRLNGKLELDERQIYTQPSHFTGRIEKLFVNYTGAKVSAGQKLATIYSPELILMQKELLSAYKMKDKQPELFNAIKTKLLRKKIHQEQIDKIIENGDVIDNFDIYAHQSGVVTKLFVNSGDHISTGEPIVELANLNQLWVIFEAYEVDLNKIHIGDIINFTVSTYPDENFKTTISYIDPIIDKNTRTARVRGAISNGNGKLKPEMLAIGNIETKSSYQQLLVPESAVLWTGERSVVYVRQPNTEDYIFEARSIEIGQLSNNMYPVKSGLHAGEEIAVNGAFTIDAAAQIEGKPNMMNMDKESVKPMSGHNHGNEDIGGIKSEPHSKKIDFSPLLPFYMDLKNSFVKTDNNKVKSYAISLSNYVKDNILNDDNIKNSPNEKKMASIYKLAIQISKESDIEKSRSDFSSISVLLLDVIAKTNSYDKNLYVLKCPMATVGDSAIWLSYDQKVLNPYYGDKMLNCGFVLKELKK
ncbi:efflux RND transporter periplasmic adaptor subunit [bacterium]|nr:MAG: efflux RND transporter periplasmic adaptor subunit [bacterium]